MTAARDGGVEGDGVGLQPVGRHLVEQSERLSPVWRAARADGGRVGFGTGSNAGMAHLIQQGASALVVAAAFPIGNGRIRAHTHARTQRREWAKVSQGARVRLGQEEVCAQAEEEPAGSVARQRRCGLTARMQTAQCCRRPRWAALGLAHAVEKAQSDG